jgi:dihydrofolate reductase
MGRLIVSTQMTLDAVIDVGEWYVPEGEHDRAGKEQLAHASAVLLGRMTYEGLAVYWSPLNDDWANLINPKPKYVASRTLHGPSSGTRRSSKATQPTPSRDSRSSFLPTC